MNSPLFELKDVTVVRSGRTILSVQELRIEAGENVAILGANGSGKTTLARLLTQEIYPYQGKGVVTILGERSLEKAEVRRRIEAVSADLESRILGEPTVREVILSGFFGTLGILWGYDVTPEQETSAHEAAEKLGVSEFWDGAISSLSSGERRRVWIARALAPNPSVLVLDEPTANLDPWARKQLVTWLRKLMQTGVSVILITHHLEELTPELTRVIGLKSGNIQFDLPRTEVLKTGILKTLLPTPPITEQKRPATAAEYLAAMQRSRVYEVAEKSDLDYCPGLSKACGNSVWLKREDHQPTFSFKIRGAYEAMARLTPAQLSHGVIAASAGNHAQGVALAANRLGARAIIVCPATTPEVKANAIRDLGAELILVGDSFDDAFQFAKEKGASEGLIFIHPYDDPWVITGQGTIGLEIDEDAPAELSTVFVAVGGGGLISGVALALKQLRPGIKVIGVEPEDSDAMHRSVDAGQAVRLDRVGLLADGVAVKRVGDVTLPIVQEWVDGLIRVSNDEICAAVKEVFLDRRAILEPAGALAYAGLKAYAATNDVHDEHLCAIACGANLNFDRLRYISERAQVGQHREAILSCEIPERPGSFLQFCRAIGHLSVTEFNYRFGDPESAHVFVGLDVTGETERELILSQLKSCGFPTLDLSRDELATTHLRHMVGGRANHVEFERYFHFDFPERPGALVQFLETLGQEWNITLFHYRNHGSDRGRVLCGFSVPPHTEVPFNAFLEAVSYEFQDVTNNPGLRLFLGSAKEFTISNI